jgi:hypothetical protein
MLPILEDKLDNLETDNQAQAQKAVTELKFLFNTTKKIPENTLASIERLVFDFSHFVNNHGEERFQQGKTKTRIKHGVGKTVIAGIVGLALGVIYSSFGDQDFNENESQGVAVIAGTFSASSIAINELFTQYAIHNSESRQLLLAEEKAIHDFETGILDVKKELQDHSKEQAQQAFEQQYNKLLLQLESVNDFLLILFKLDSNNQSKLMMHEFNEAQQAIKNKIGKIDNSIEAIEQILELYSQPDVFRYQLSWALTQSGAFDATLLPLARAAKGAIDSIDKLSKYQSDYNDRYNSSLYTTFSQPERLRL